eukprot:g7785.t1
MQHFGDGTSFFENNDDIEENHILELQAEREELVSFRLELGNKLSMEARKLQLHQAASGVGGALSDEAAELHEIMRSVGAMAAEDSKLAEMEKDSRFPELVRLQGENGALQSQVDDFDERLKALKAGAAGAGGGGGKEKDAKVIKGAARGGAIKGKTSGPASPSSPASPEAAACGFSKEDPSGAEADAAGHAGRSKCKSPKAGKKGAQPSSAAPPQPSATDAAAAIVADLLPTGRGSRMDGRAQAKQDKAGVQRRSAHSRLPIAIDKACPRY